MLRLAPAPTRALSLAQAHKQSIRRYSSDNDTDTDTPSPITPSPSTDSTPFDLLETVSAKPTDYTRPSGTSSTLSDHYDNPKSPLHTPSRPAPRPVPFNPHPSHPFAQRNPHETHTSIFTQLFPKRRDYAPSPPPPRKPTTDRDFELLQREPPDAGAEWEIPRPAKAERVAMEGGAGDRVGKRENEAWKDMRERFPILGNKAPMFRQKYWGLQQEYAAMLTVRNTITGLSATDFDRILPKGLHIPGKFWSILKTIPKRNPRTLEPTGTYYLLFPTETNALVYRSEFHRLQRLYSQRTPYAPSHPETRPYALSGPNSNKISMEITVGPPAILQRFRPGYKANLFRRKEYAVDPSGGIHGTGPDTLVQLLLSGDQMTLGRLYMLLNADERTRGIPWDLVRSWCRKGIAFSLEDANLQGRRKTPLSPRLPAAHPAASESDTLLPASHGPIEEDDDLAANLPSRGDDIRLKAETGENPLNLGSNQFLLLFTSHLEAQRFVRGWNGRDVLFSNSGGTPRKTAFRARIVMDVWVDDDENKEVQTGGEGSMEQQQQQQQQKKKKKKGIYESYYKKKISV